MLTFSFLLELLHIFNTSIFWLLEKIMWVVNLLLLHLNLNV